MTAANKIIKSRNPGFNELQKAAERIGVIVQLLDEKYTSGMFIGDGYQFDLVNDPTAGSSMNIFNYLQGKVAGLQVNAT